MGELLFLAPLLLLPAVASALKARKRNARERAARRAAEAAGLTGIRPGDPRLGEAFLEGRSGDLSVSLEAYRLESGDSGMRIVVTGPGHAAGELSLLREDLPAAWEKRAGGEREIETGDPAFDEEFFVQGQAPLVLAILGPETRRVVRNLMRHTLAIPGGRSLPVETSLRRGVLEMRLPDGLFSVSLERAPDVVPRVLEVARLLVAPSDLAARLAENLHAEPMAGVRRQCLATLVREFPDDPATRPALLASLHDPDAEVRVRAAIAVGPEGRDVLLAVAGGAPDETSARAVSGRRVRKALRRIVVASSSVSVAPSAFTACSVVVSSAPSPRARLSSTSRPSAPSALPARSRTSASGSWRAARSASRVAG